MDTNESLSPNALWEHHLLATQAWLKSGFRDQASARAGVKALEQWLGAYPNQARDVVRIALASAVAAFSAECYDIAAGFAATVLEAAAFMPLADADDHAAPAFAALMAEQCRLETGRAAMAGASLAYARALVQGMDETSALRTWAEAQCELVAAISAEAILERRQAATSYAVARDALEPLLRNPRLNREVSRDWIRVVYGDVQQVIEQQPEANQLVPTVLRYQYVRAALGAARTAEPSLASRAAVIAADALAESGLAGGCTTAELRGALINLPEEQQLALIDRLLPVFAGEARNQQAAKAALLGLRLGTKAGSAADWKQAGVAVQSARDAYSWAALWAGAIDLQSESKRDLKDRHHAADVFLLVLGQLLPAVRNTSRHLPLLAQFDRALTQTTSYALAEYRDHPDLRSSARLSASLEARRKPLGDVGSAITKDDALSALEEARLAASDWLGRVVHAARLRPEALVLIPTWSGSGFQLLAISETLEILETPSAFLGAAAELSEAMVRYFEPGRPGSDFAALGKRAYDALPDRLRALLELKRTILICPDAAGPQAAFPYELLRGPKGFLGITHVVARMPSLQAVAGALEPEVMPPERMVRAVCAAAPHAIAEQPLKLAEPEVKAANQALKKAGWDARTLSEGQLTADVVLDACAKASLVHLAVHGEASGGAHGIRLTPHERLDTSGIETRRGRLPAAVYLSACSVGASEYLGGGVSRGFAQALHAKGAPAIVASQWPLEDAAAKTLASEFYRKMVRNPVGEAVRAAREKASKTASPALWASLILIGNPWHEPGGGTASTQDAATRFLLTASDPSGAKAKKRKAHAVAAAASAADGDDRRLAAALVWADEFESMLGRQSPGLDAVRAQDLAVLARDLGAFGGETLCWIAAADLLQQEGRLEAAPEALDRAIDAADAAARSDPNWSRVLNAALTKREEMDLDFDVPEIETQAGLKVNDRSDPSVRAILDLQKAVDRREQRRGGVLKPRLPERSLDDLCWNAVLLGEKNRFPTEFACGGFCRLLAERAVRIGVIGPEAESAIRRVAAGALHYLWSAQRMTHLERERAIGQAGTLRVALEAATGSAIADDARLSEAQREIETLGEQFSGQAQNPAASRFARARLRLHGEETAGDAGTFTSAVLAFVEDAAAGTRSHAHRFAWGAGYLLELAYELTLGNRLAAAAPILAAYARLEEDAESHLWAYLGEGYAEVRSAPLDPLLDWQ